MIYNKPNGSESSVKYDDFSNYLFLSTLYVQAKQEKPAIDSVKKALESANNKEMNQVARISLASVQQTFGHLELAESNLREILKETPGYPIALNNLGYVLLRQGKNLGEALNLITNALKVEPKNPSYLDSLGWTYFKLERLDKAELYLEKAIRLNSTSPTILEHLGDVYRKRGKIDKAEEVWQRALVFTSNADDSERIKTKLAR